MVIDQLWIITILCKSESRIGNFMYFYVNHIFKKLVLRSFENKTFQPLKGDLGIENQEMILQELSSIQLGIDPSLVLILSNHYGLVYEIRLLMPFKYNY